MLILLSHKLAKTSKHVTDPLSNLDVDFLYQVVGDDLLMSNPKRIERAVQDSSCNALLLKVLALMLGF